MRIKKEMRVKSPKKYFKVAKKGKKMGRPSKGEMFFEWCLNRAIENNRSAISEIISAAVLYGTPIKTEALKISLGGLDGINKKGG